MKIRFKKNRLYSNLFFGIVWTILGIFKVINNDSSGWLNYGFLAIGVLYIGHYLFDLSNQYLILENGTLRKNKLYGFGKKINLKEINLIKKFGGDYILKTPTKELTINTELIEEKSLTELNKVLTELNLPSEKTPFLTSV
jgi:hypothetical protein